MLESSASQEHFLGGWRLSIRGLVNHPHIYVPWKVYLAKFLFQQQTGHSEHALRSVANHSLSVRQ